MKEKIFISVIHHSYMYFKILNKNTRVCTLSFKFFFFFFHNILLKQILNEEHFTCAVHCKKQSTLYEQVDALETEITEENHAIKKQNPTWTATKNYSSLQRWYWRLLDGFCYYQSEPINGKKYHCTILVRGKNCGETMRRSKSCSSRWWNEELPE